MPIKRLISKIPKLNPEMKLLAPENRGFLLVASVAAMLSLAAIGAYAMSDSGSSDSSLININTISKEKTVVTADAKVSELYQASIQQTNQESYEKAMKQSEGAEMPRIYHTELGETESAIESCGCTWNEKSRQDMIAELAKLGYTGIKTSDAMRVGGSDIYIWGDGTLVDSLGIPYLFDGAEVATDSTGVVQIKKTGMDITTANKESVYLSNVGAFYDKNTQVIQLKGRLLSSRGVIILGSGQKTNRAGNMNQVGNSDVYVTTEEQLTTIDGKPVLHSSNFVFKNDDLKLRDKFNQEISWRGKIVIQSEDGLLHDNTGIAFTKNGILFSYDGILIDNNSFLTSQLKDIERFGTSDILKDNNGNLVDSFSQNITFRGYSIKVGVNGLLNAQVGKVKNYKNSDVSIKQSGRLVAEIAVVLTGTLKNSESVAYDKYGHLISRKGKLIRLGQSDIWHTSDRFLASENGKPIVFNQKDTFQDINRFKQINGLDAYGLRTFDSEIVTDLLMNEVFLNSLGHIVYETGEPINQTGLLSQFNGVLLNNSGISLGRSDELSLITDEDGNPVLFNGHKVYKGSDGRIYDELGNVVVSKEGLSVALTDDNVLVDEDGNVISEPLLFSSPRSLSDNEELQLRSTEQVFSLDGSPLMYNGKKVFKRADGTLVDELGQAITGINGEPLTLDSNGQIIDSTGKKATLRGFTVNGERPDNSGFKTASATLLEQVLSSDGSALMYNGKNVFKRADGVLVDEFGQEIIGADGKPLKMDANGQIVDSTGKKADLSEFSVNGKPVKNGGFRVATSSTLKALGKSGISQTLDGLLVDKKGRAITINNKRVRRTPNGQLFDENGRPILDEDGNLVFMDENGNLYSPDGKEIKGVVLLTGDGQIMSPAEGPSTIKRIGKSNLYLSKEGLLTDANSKPIYFNGDPVKLGKGGRLKTLSGKYVTDSGGNSVYLNTKGELKNKRGEFIKGAPLTTRNGVVIDPKGLLVTNGGKLTKLSEDGLYKTAEGLIVTADGKSVKINGENLYITDDNLLVSAYSKPIRFRGKKLSLNRSGDLVDELGGAILQNGESLQLSTDGLVTEDGRLIDPEPISDDSKQRYTPDKNVVELINGNKSNQRKDAAKEVEPVISAKATTDVSEEILPRLDVERLSIDEITRINKRYQRIRSAMMAKLGGYSSKNLEKPQTMDAAISGQAFVESIQQEPELTAAEIPRLSTSEPEFNKDGQVQKAGTFLYVANTMKVNTDLNSKLIFNVMGMPHTHFLYKATAHGTVTMKYDNIVTEFNSICLASGKCIPINGIGVDPATKEASIDGDIDKHYWYRFGGLALATLTQGAAMAVGESPSRTEVLDPTGKVTTYSGLDGDKLLVRSTGVLGESLASVFMENVNRPPTGTIEKDEEIAIILFQDVFEPVK